MTKKAHMKNDRNEYLPTDKNEQQKIFRLAPVQDDVTFKVIQTRMDAFRHKQLTMGAKVLFCFLLDLSMDNYRNVIRGVVTISATKITESIHCCRESVFIWLKELQRARFVWMDKTFMPNFWAMNRYHINALDPQESPMQLPTRDGHWGNGARRPVAPRVGFGSENEGGVVEKTARQISGDSPVSEENPPEAWKNSDATGGKNRPPPWKKPHAGRGKNLTPRVEKTARVASKKPHATHTEISTPQVEKTEHIRSSKNRELEPFQEGGKAPQPPLEAFKESIKGEFRSRLVELKRELKAKIETAKTPEARKTWRERLKAVEDEMLGGAVPDEAPAKPRVARKAPETVQQLTELEMLDSIKNGLKAGGSIEKWPAFMQAAYRKFKAEGRL